MTDMCDIKEQVQVLDAPRGGGVFYDNHPNHCEITENKDCFDCRDKFGVTLGNPPYSV